MMMTVKTFFCCLLFLATLQAITGETRYYSITRIRLLPFHTSKCFNEMLCMYARNERKSPVLRESGPITLPSSCMQVVAAIFLGDGVILAQ